MSIHLIFSGRTHKESETMTDCQDFFHLNSQQNCFAIADGASQSFYPSLWAELLVNHFCQNPDINQENWQLWLKPIQEEWLQKVKEKVEKAKSELNPVWVTNTNRLNYRESATSTFIGLEFLENYLKVSLVGDSCLFIVKNHQSINTLIVSYPIENSQDFGNRPEYFASYEKNNDFQPKLLDIPLDKSSNLEEKYYFILATDALSEFIFQCLENNKDIWDLLITISSENEFKSFVKEARHSKDVKMKNDDVTLMILEVNNLKIPQSFKCWVENLGDLKNRYQAIDNYLTTVKLPYFVDFAYQKEGIIVNGQKYPIVRMEWVEGVSFKEFIANNINNPVSIRDFADQFLEMATILHEKNISHGDLQHGNIKVRSNGDICLIDYDSLYVPQLSNEKDVIKGLPGYQHPKRKDLDKLSPKSDYFSELIIYLSLLVIAENHHYWRKIEQEERLIFSDKDLINPSSSSTFKELKKLSEEIIYFTEQLEKSCQTSNIEYLQPLEILVNGYKGKKKTWDFPINTKPNLTPPPSPTIKIDTKPPVITNPTPQVSDPWVKVDNKLKQKKDDPWSIFGEKPHNPFDDKFPQKTPVSIPQKDPFDKIETDKSQPSQPDPFDNIKSSEPVQPQPVVTDKNLWDKFDHIWKKLSKSVSSIWNRIINWFN